jgi:nucleoid-associated protein YgaU
VTEKDPETSADEERWLTYLEYDQTVRQAVRRLGALSSGNVDEFRMLLMNGRDRTRVQEYEAESIRRLQGEAFVGDEDLQRALIVLNAEDARLGDELKRLVAATGRPSDLDQAVAVIRSQKEFVGQPEQTSDRVEVELVPQQAAPEPAVLEPVPAKTEEPPRRQQAALAPAALERIEPVQKTSRIKRLAVLGAVLVVGAVGLVMVSSRRDSQAPSVQATTPPLRPAAAEIARPAVASNPVAQHSLAPSVQLAMPAQNDKPPGPAPSQASPGQEAPSNAVPASDPVPGARYKVVRGDMLTEIALRAYRDASKYKLIQAANPNLRNGPDIILVDQVIFIPPAP